MTTCCRRIRIRKLRQGMHLHAGQAISGPDWKTVRRRSLLLFLGVALALSSPQAGGAAAPESARDISVPGVVIDYSPAATKRYIGSPSIAILPDGTYVASHDIFGPGSQMSRSAVFQSPDRGETWRQVARLQGQWWSTLFVHRGVLYIMGTNRRYGDVVIRRSTDGGHSWTEPRDENSGLLLTGAEYHCAPVPVLLHRGRLWRAMEDAEGGGGWGAHFRSFMMSVPAAADLLVADNWTCSNRLARDPSWLDGRFRGWLEGNAVAAPDGSVVNVLRVDDRQIGGQAAVVRISDDGRQASFDPQQGFIDFPGANTKFTIRRDPQTGHYWSLANFVPPKHEGRNKGATRNTLALTHSPDLVQWSVRCIVLYHPDVEKHGFQYVDWLFDGDDIVAVSRTAYDDGAGGAHNYHDANYLTFHRIEGFRRLTLEDSVVDPAPLLHPRRTVVDTEAFRVEGLRFQLATLGTDQQAFGNRTYVWKDVPEEFSGWSYTRTAGGVRAEIAVHVREDTLLHVATAASQAGIDMSGWQRIPDRGFFYTDGGRTRMSVFRRTARAGETVAIPQGNWTGALLLVPGTTHTVQP